MYIQFIQFQPEEMEGGAMIKLGSNNLFRTSNVSFIRTEREKRVKWKLSKRVY